MSLVRIVSHGHIYLQERLGILIFHFLTSVIHKGKGKRYYNTYKVNYTLSLQCLPYYLYQTIKIK